MALLRAFNAAGQTIIVVTHDPHMAVQINRTVILKDGQVVDEVQRKERPKTGTDDRDIQNHST